MPRKPSAILPVATKQAINAAQQAILDSPLCQRALAPHRPVDLAHGLLRQAIELRWVQGDSSPAVAIATALYERQLALTVVMLYRDPRVQMRWDLLELREFLDIELKRTLGVVSQRPVVIKCPSGAPLGSKREYARHWTDPELLEEIPQIIDRLGARYKREKTRRPQWTKDIAKALQVKPLTVLSYLDRLVELQRYLDDARGTNKAIPELGVRHG